MAAHQQRAAARQTNCGDAEHRGVPAARVRVLALRRPKPRILTEECGATVVNCTSRSHDVWARGLSPFFCGPVPLYGGRVARCVENAWQYTKLYAAHADPATGAPTRAYWEWAQRGWDAADAARFPMGRGAVPLCSLWDGARLGYIDARKRIYCPLYAAAVQQTAAFAQLRRLYEDAVRRGVPLVLHDFDGWDHVGQRFSLREVVESPRPIMGHAFVLAGLLENDRFWE